MYPRYATGKYTAAAIRQHPRAGAPMLSQLLLGEPLRSGEVIGEFTAIERSEDGLQGYVATNQLLGVDAALHRQQLREPCFALDLFATVLSDRFGMPVSFGARLPAYDGLQLRHGDTRFLYSGKVLRPHEQVATAEMLLKLARQWCYVAELPGGRTSTGIDGAGLVQLLLRLAGHQLPASLQDMSRQGESVDFVVQCQEGDLAFFDDHRGRLTHVGLILSATEILHVRGRVRIDGLDHFGIFDRKHRRYTHRLRVMRRWLPTRSAGTVVLTDSLAEIGPDSRQASLF